MKLQSYWLRLRARLRVLANRFDALSLRERGVLVVGVALLMLAIWDTVGMRPLYARANTASAQLASLSSDTAVSDLGRLVDLETQLRAQQTQKQLRLEQRAGGLVDPVRMPELLTDVLRSSHGLRLVKLSNLPVEELRGPAASVEGAMADTDGKTTAPSDTPPAVAFVHGIDLTVAGDFAAVNDYIRALESQSWHFLWRKVELDASNYPEISAHLEVATLGLERQWLTI